MSRSLFLMAALAFVLTAWTHAAESPLKPLSEYSVELVTTSFGTQGSSKIYRTKDKCRIENGDPANVSVSIKRGDLQKIYLLAPARKLYVESSYNPAGDTDVLAPPGKAIWENTGTETVNGITCDKYILKTRLGSQKNSMIYFVDTKGLPVRTEITSEGQTITVDYKNWTEGPQDPALFEVPDGYKKQ